MSDGEKTKSRKLEHIEITTSQDVEMSKSTGFSDVLLVHNSLPELSMSGIDLSTKLVGKPVRAPIMVAGMTGGHPIA
ncbi:MAG: type 2 isopentenyl-diphosphate Delta-isomerase, partial [Candidatus Diapherotrites archaeon]|nr:type 2 isopentenyl-diphosphate Delta-isomerase [Candidatus Diapherotrites archaeon]